MDAEEASLYLILILAVVIICVILTYSAFAALRRHAIYHKIYKREIDTALNKLESERGRIAADIHDDLGPLLSAIKINLATIAPADDADKAQVEKCSVYLGTTSQKLRDIAQGLMPAVLIKKGLQAAINQFISDFNLKNGLELDLKTDILPALSQKASIHIYRIVQEIVHNCIKHAGATYLAIDIECGQQYLTIRTADNGKGFNEKEVRQRDAGYGLTTLQSRIQLLNGRCSLKTFPGKGTRYAIDIPVSSITETSS